MYRSCDGWIDLALGTREVRVDTGNTFLLFHLHSGQPTYLLQSHPLMYSPFIVSSYFIIFFYVCIGGSGYLLWHRMDRMLSSARNRKHKSNWL